MRGRWPARGRRAPRRATRSRAITRSRIVGVGRRQLDHQPAFEPGPQPGLDAAASSASGTAEVKTIWRPDSSRLVEEHEELVLGAVVLGRRDARRRAGTPPSGGSAPARRGPRRGRSPRSARSVNSGALRQATGPPPAGEQVADRVEQVGLSHPAGPDDARAGCTATPGCGGYRRGPPRAPCGCRPTRRDRPGARAAKAPAADGSLPGPAAGPPPRRPGRRDRGRPPSPPARARARRPPPASPGAAATSASNARSAPRGSVTISCSSSCSSRVVRKPSPSQRRMAAPTLVRHASTCCVTVAVISDRKSPNSSGAAGCGS